MKTIVVFALISSIFCEFDFKGYLSQFGYHNEESFAPKNITESILLFQRTFRLKETGIIDADTLNLMKTPRCGNKDISASAYRDYGWGKTDLSYYYYNYTPDLKKEEVRSIMNEALKFWSDVTPLKFTERDGGDINIAFGRFVHRDNHGMCWSPFGGQGGVLAHAFFPPSGRIHFDDSEDFTAHSPRGINLLWVATHEMGHILGLEHDTWNKNAVMYPYYRRYTPDMHLDANDIKRIQKLYGKKTGGGGGTGTHTTSRPVTTGGGGGGESCTNDNPRCEEWAKRGECHTSHGMWMTAHCCKACKDFGGGGGGTCTDTDRNCQRWAQQGYCQGSHGRWMRAHCCRSCGVSI